MKHQIEQSIKVNVPAETLWQIMKDFSSVEKYATTIESSPIINDIHSGLGAKRLCTFSDGSSLVEEIIEYNEGQSFKMELSEYSMPLKYMFAEMQVKSIDAKTSELSMSSEFSVKAGILGWFMGAALMCPMMKGVFKKLMTGLAYYAVTGESIAKKLPPKEKLTNLVLN